jgi:hypothetical protein
MIASTALPEAVAKTQSVDLQAIVLRFGNSLNQSRRLHSTQRKALWSIAHCRTPAMGGHVERCRRCQFARYQYHSCRNRHCPQCQSQASSAWREARMRELLPIPYFHHVFTLPHKLNPWVLRSERNYRELISLLFRATAETLQQFGREQFGGQLGITMVLHTWDQRLRPHFHVHCLVPSGALCDGGTRWAAGGRKFLFPVKALSKVFRAKYLDGLKRLILEDKVDVPESCDSMIDAIRNGNARCLARHFRPPWVVYAQRPFAGPEKLLDYLSRYVHRTAISNHRILAIEGDNVRFSYRDRADGDRRKTETLTGEAFLRRFLVHVLPKGLTRIRHYGFMSNRMKKKNLNRCRQLLGAAVPVLESEPSFAEWFLALTGIDLTACPACGSRLERTEIDATPCGESILRVTRPNHTPPINSS